MNKIMPCCLQCNCVHKNDEMKTEEKIEYNRNVTHNKIISTDEFSRIISITKDKYLINNSHNNSLLSQKSTSSEAYKKEKSRKVLMEALNERRSSSKINNNNEIKGKHQTISFVKNEDSLHFSFLNNNNSISSYQRLHQVMDDNINEIWPTWVLEEKEGNWLNGEKIIIQPTGWINSPRKKKDGFVYFGAHYSESYTNNQTVNNIPSKVINDVILQNLPDSVSTSSPLFLIYFNSTSHKYFIRPLIPWTAPFKQSMNTININNSTIINNSVNTTSNANYLFVKLNSIYQLHSNDLFIINKYSISIHIEQKTQEWTINIFEHTHHIGKYQYKATQKSSISIGRDKNCNIYIDNKSLSKIHSTLFYNNEISRWCIQDGDTIPSKNGTWWWLKHSYELLDNSVFKINSQSLIRTSFINKHENSKIYQICVV